jgi:two-component system, sensor histidine kinase
MRPEERLRQVDFQSLSPILVVEDHPITRCAIEEMLETLGYTADFAKNGEEALARYQETSYLLVLMDVELPGLSGIEVTKAIRNIEKKKHLKAAHIVAITSHCDDPACREKCLKAGMNAVQGKPSLELLRILIADYVL